MKYLIYLLFVLLSFGQLQRFSFLGQQVNIYIHEIVMAVMVMKQIGQIHRIRVGKEIIFFLGILLLSLVNNFWQFNLQQNLIGFLYWARLTLYLAFFTVLLNWGSRGRNKGILGKGLNVFVTLTIIFSYLQYFLYPNLRNLYYLGWDPHQSRVFGFFFDTSISGAILVMMFFWMVGREKIRLIGLIGQIGLIGLILLTYSRITYLSFIVGVIYYLSKKTTLKKILFLIFIFSFLIFLLPRPFGEGVKLERVFTIEARAIDFKEGLKLWWKKPILGYGYNRLRYVRQADNFTHAGASFSSSFLTILATSGLIGLIGLIGFIGRIFKQGNHLIRTIILIAIVASLFDNVLLNNFVLLLLLLIVAISSNLLFDKSPSVL